MVTVIGRNWQIFMESFDNRIVYVNYKLIKELNNFSRMLYFRTDIDIGATYRCLKKSEKKKKIVFPVRHIVIIVEKWK